MNAERSKIQASQEDAGSASTRPASVAVIHDQGDSVCVVIAERSGDAARIVLAESVAAGSGVAARVRELVERRGAERVVRVARSGDAVCRVVEAPQDERRGAMEDAIDLLAEAELPGEVPFWRRGAELLETGATAGMRAALLTAVPEDRSTFEPVLPDDASSRETIVAEPLGLAALLTIGSADRPPHAGVFVGNPHVDSIGVAASGLHHTVVRSIRETGEDRASFETAGDAAFEAAMRRAHLSDGAVDDVVRGSTAGGRRMMITRSAAEGFAARMEGARAEGEWLASFGVAAAVAERVLTSGVRPGGAYDLRDAEPKRRRSPLVRVAAPLSEPRNAVALAALALVLVSFVPAIAAWARMNALTQRAERYEAELGLVAGSSRGEGPSIDERREFYAVLDETRAPMTKVLADLAASLPAESVEEIALVERLSVELDEGFRLTGRTQDRDLVAAFTRKLDETTVFDGISIERVSSPAQAGAPIEFEVIGRVSRPFAAARGVRDYASNPAAEFIYGVVTDEEIAAAIEAEAALRRAEAAERREAEDAESGATVADESDDGDIEGDGVRVVDADGDGDANGGGATADARRRSTPAGSSRRPERDESVARSVEESGQEEVRLADDETRAESRRQVFEGGSRAQQEEAAPEPVPDALTDAEIGEMGRIEALRASLDRKRIARERSDLDEETKARLEDEAERLRQRAREAAGD